MKPERLNKLINFFISISLWLHSLATVVFIGHHLLLALVYIPGRHAWEYLHAEPRLVVRPPVNLHHHGYIHDAY